MYTRKLNELTKTGEEVTEKEAKGQTRLDTATSFLGVA